MNGMTQFCSCRRTVGIVFSFCKCITHCLYCEKQYCDDSCFLEGYGPTAHPVLTPAQALALSPHYCGKCSPSRVTQQWCDLQRTRKIPAQTRKHRGPVGGASTRNRLCWAESNIKWNSSGKWCQNPLMSQTARTGSLNSRHYGSPITTLCTYYIFLLNIHNNLMTIPQLYILASFKKGA